MGMSENIGHGGTTFGPVGTIIIRKSGGGGGGTDLWGPNVCDRPLHSFLLGNDHSFWRCENQIQSFTSS